MAAGENRTYLKKVFWPNLGVGAGFQILNILQYACGLKPGPAYTLDQNPFFETGSSEKTGKVEKIEKKEKQSQCRLIEHASV